MAVRAADRAAARGVMSPRGAGVRDETSEGQQRNSRETNDDGSLLRPPPLLIRCIHTMWRLYQNLSNNSRSAFKSVSSRRIGSSMRSCRRSRAALGAASLKLRALPYQRLFYLLCPLWLVRSEEALSPATHRTSGRTSTVDTRPAPPQRRRPSRRSACDRRKTLQLRSFDRREGTEPGDDRVEIRIEHATEIRLTGQRLLERPPVARHAVREGSLDLRVGPRADAGPRVRGDVGGHRRSPWAFERVTALAEGIPVVRNAVRSSAVAFHAMGDRGAIEAPPGRIAERLFGERFFSAGNGLDVHRRLVDRRLHDVAHWRERAQVRDQRIEVTRRQYLVEREGHLRREPPAVRPDAVREGALDVTVAPRADPRLAIGRDIGTLDGVRRRVPGSRPAGEALLHDESARSPRRMAPVTGHDGIDEIAAALDWCLGGRDTDRHEARGHAQDHEPGQHPTVPHFGLHGLGRRLTSGSISPASAFMNSTSSTCSWAVSPGDLCPTRATGSSRRPDRSTRPTSASVRSLPSCMYGPRRATSRSVGVLNLDSR